MFNSKKKIVICILILCLILTLCILAPYLVKNMYIHSIIRLEKPVESYDGKFAFLTMPTEKWYVNALNIYDADPVICAQKIETFKHKYNKFDMEKIMWGNQNYDLFFWTREATYIYKYDEKTQQWIGPAYFHTTKTEELRLQGIDDVYCFDTMGYLDVIVPDEFFQVSKQSAPACFVEDMERILELYRRNFRW